MFTAEALPITAFYLRGFNTDSQAGMSAFTSVFLLILVPILLPITSEIIQ